MYRIGNHTIVMSRYDFKISKYIALLNVKVESPAIKLSPSSFFFPAGQMMVLGGVRDSRDQE